MNSMQTAFAKVGIKPNRELGLAVAETHIGWFDVPMCNRVVEIIRARK